MRVENGEIILETMTAEEWKAIGEALAPEKLERFFKENNIMGVKKSKGKQLSAAEIEDQEFLNGETAAPVAVIVKKEVVPTPVHNLRAKKRLSNERRLRAVFEGRHKRGQKLPDGWKGDGFTMEKSNKKKEVPKTKTETQVEKVLRKMKVRNG